MTQGKSILDREFAKRVIRVALAIVGLLILRAVLGALPMVKNASSIGSSLLTPLVLAQAIVDTVIFVLILRFGVGLGSAIQANYTRLPDLGKIVSLAFVALVLVLAYSSYQTVTACLVESASDTLKGASGPQGCPPGVDEATCKMLEGIQNASRSITERGIPNLPGSLLEGYQEMAVVAFRQSPDIYGWTFLILIAIPVVYIVVLISRNLDALTEMVFHAATASSKPVAADYGVAASSRGPYPAVGGAGPGDSLERLGKLKALLDAHVISWDDFEGQKLVILRGFQPGVDPDELRKLKTLLDGGALTPEEYDVQKQRFLLRL